MMELKYSEILKLNKDLGNSLEGDDYKITVLSNVIMNQLNEVLELSIRLQGVKAKVTQGDYDNILQDSARFADSKLTIIFWEPCNLVDGFQAKANLMNAEAIDAMMSKVKNEIDFALSNLKYCPLILVNRFSSMVFNHATLRSNNFDFVCDGLNKHLETKTDSNVQLIDIDKIISKISVSRSVDFRYYYSSKALYTIEFYKAYAAFVSPILHSIRGKSKKALIFDCDNTLWKGVLGEDGMDNIEMSGATKGGVVFQEVQNLAIELARKGVIIGLCSKNNPEDVNKVLVDHPDMQLRDRDITIKAVNWDDKATNLQRIAKELNIGLDSLVFVDDSEFELGLINERLKEVATVRVPVNLYEYPQLIRECQRLFFNISETTEDSKKGEMYKQEAHRKFEKESFDNIDSYLAALDLEMRVFEDERSFIPRISQLTQKTNQFNLTTKRYTETEIENFVKRKDSIVLSFEVADKYGDYGLTGLSIIRLSDGGSTAEIDSMLMSCRIIGRNLEFAFFDYLFSKLKSIGVKSVDGGYFRTMKNQQVEDLYEKVGFTCTQNMEGEAKIYKLDLEKYKNQNINYIKIKNGREN
jgi:FkbH-like protein